MESDSTAKRRRGRPKKESEASEPPAYIRWIRDRAYGEFRAWKAWGGGQEGLVARGERFATGDANTAAVLFGARVGALRELRERHPDGLPTGDRDRLGLFAGYHIGRLREREGRKPLTEAYLEQTFQRLETAVAFLATRGRTRLRELGPADVAAYAEHLRTATFSPGGKGRKPQRLGPTSQRRYLDALGNMLQRAVGEGRIPMNFVAEMVDKPTADASPTEHLELGEGALILEAARRLYPLREGERPIYPLLAFYLLTGVIESERKGVQLRDVHLPGDPIYPRGVVIIRPNEARDHLKSVHRDRMIPMHPQLAEILAEYLAGPTAPPGPLLFPEPGTRDVPIGDWRTGLDRIGQLSGYPAGSLRTRRFRVTYATHRLSTLDYDGQPMTAWKLRGEMGHGTEQMIEQRYGRYAKHRARRPVLEYRWAEWEPTYGDRLSAVGRELHPAARATLARLGNHPRGLTARDWEVADGSLAGSFYPRRDRLLSLGLVERVGGGRGARFRLTKAGREVLKS